MTVTYLRLAPAVCSQSGSVPSPATRRTQEGPTGPETALPFRRRRGQRCGSWERWALVPTVPKAVGRGRPCSVSRCSLMQLFCPRGSRSRGLSLARLGRSEMAGTRCTAPCFPRCRCSRHRWAYTPAGKSVGSARTKDIQPLLAHSSGAASQNASKVPQVINRRRHCQQRMLSGPGEQPVRESAEVVQDAPF